MALFITNDRRTAERIVTAAFASTWHSDRDAGPAAAKSFFSLLMATVRTKAVVARTARSTPVSFDRPNGHQPTNSLGMAVAMALRDLPESQQHVLALAYFGGLGVGAIASELREPVSHVKVNLHAALGHLRSVLAEPRGRAQ
ncbi:MAG: RNA polymerase sigma factor [Gemmatimonadaceae bacterium]